MPTDLRKDYRPRLPLHIGAEIHRVALRRGISDDSALKGVVMAGLAAMNGVPVVPTPSPAPAPAPNSDAATA